MVTIRFVFHVVPKIGRPFIDHQHQREQNIRLCTYRSFIICSFTVNVVRVSLSIPVVANDAGLNFRTCYSYGPNYYRTFDGLEYLFPGRCKYTAFSDGSRSVMVTMVNCNKYSTCRKVNACAVDSGNDTTFRNNQLSVRHRIILLPVLLPL